MFEITSILPLIKNNDFIDFVFKNNVKFSSIENKELANIISEIIKYLLDNYSENTEKISFNYTSSEIASNDFALQLGPVIEKLKDNNEHNKWSNTAKKLNNYGFKSRIGNSWDGVKVKHVWNRWYKLNKEHTLKVGPLLDQLDDLGFKSFDTKAYMLNSKDLLTLEKKEWDYLSIEKAQGLWGQIKEEDSFKKVLSPN